MSSESRKQLIANKVAANSERRQRDCLLESVDAVIAQSLSVAPCVYTPEADSVLKRFLPATPSGIGAGQQTQPKNYYFNYTDNPQSPHSLPEDVGWMIEQTNGWSLDAACHFVLRRPVNYFTLRSAALTHDKYGAELCMYPVYPLFVVTLRFAISAIAQLWPLAGGFFAVVGRDLEAGMICDHWWDESGYQVARWPAQAG